MRESSFQSPVLNGEHYCSSYVLSSCSKGLQLFFPHTTSKSCSHCYVILMLSICNEFHKLTYVQMIFQPISTLKKKKTSLYIICEQKTLSILH